MLNGLFTPVLHCIGHYINAPVQGTTKLKHRRLPAKTSQFGYFPHSNDLFATLASHFPFISPTPFLSSFQRGRLTEQGSIQPEGTVSGRGNLTSCSTQSREYNLPVLSWPASLRIHTLHVCSQFALCFISYTKWTVILYKVRRLPNVTQTKLNTLYSRFDQFMLTWVPPEIACLHMRLKCKVFLCLFAFSPIIITMHHFAVTFSSRCRAMNN